jgi:uracil-DNA glycosylase family 4
VKRSKISELYKNCSAIITENTQEIHRLILGYGNCDAELIIVTEIPSAKEEELGIPFVGKAGKDLEDLLNQLGLSTDDVYITNFVKYRPYKISENSGRIVNRAPTKEEMDFFLPYIENEINIISPKIIITLGQEVIRGLMNDDEISINEVQGKVQKKTIKGVKYRLFPMLHQSAFMNLKSEEKKKEIETLITLFEHAKEEKREEKPVETHKITPKSIIKPKKEKKDKKREVATPKKKTSGKTIIVYAGNGYADDPTLVAVDRVSSVLTELNVNIIRLDIHKNEYDIEHFFNELQEARSIVIATTVEWIGIPGRLQDFLDRCYFYGNKAFFKGVMLLSIVISKQGYERDANNHIMKCWELLGGVDGEHILACIKKASTLETDSALLNTIDKKTEGFFRAINQNRKPLPTSFRENTVLIEVPSHNTVIVQEEALNSEEENQGVYYDETDEPMTSIITNYDEYIEKQQKDIADISDLFKQKLKNSDYLEEKDEVEIFKSAYLGPKEDVRCIIQWRVEDKRSRNIVMEIKNDKINVYFGEVETFNLIMTLSNTLLQKIVRGQMTIQRAFMTGEIKAQGDFSLIYKLDSMFKLSENK